jgi:AcrR family transcriptional regulator
VSTDAVSRDDLIATAWQVLDRTGFEGFKVASVMRAADTSARSFYRHFDSKDDLLVELLLDESRRGSARIDRLVDAADGAADAVRAWIAATTSAAATPKLQPRVRLFASLTQRIEGHHEAIAASRSMLRRSLVVAIESGCRSGELRSPDPLGDAIRIQALSGALVNDLLQSRTPEDPAVLIAGIQDFALRALSAPVTTEIPRSRRLRR